MMAGIIIIVRDNTKIRNEKRKEENPKTIIHFNVGMKKAQAHSVGHECVLD